MNGELLRLVDSIRRDKNIPRDVVLDGIEAALLSAARKHLGGSEDIEIKIDRESGEIQVVEDGVPVDLEVLGRIAAQTAKQVIIQKIREAERDSLFDEYESFRGTIVNGSVQRQEGGAYIINLGKTEGILPRSESIPGENSQAGDRIRCVVIDVRKSGQRVKIVLSRTHPDLVRRLFELEVPEIAERIIEIKAMAREAGYRTKIAVSSIDSKVDCVGACVGVRGTRIKNIVDELGGEKIDIVRWNDALQVLIPNALKPAEIEDILLCPELDRAVVLVPEDQLSLAIGRRGQNVRLASRLVEWDIEIMTRDEYEQHRQRAAQWFGEIPHVGQVMLEKLIAKGFLSYEDLSLLETEHLTAIDGIGQKRAEEIIAFATEAAERIEREQPDLVNTRLRPAPGQAKPEQAEEDSEEAAVEALRKTFQDDMAASRAADEAAGQPAAARLFAVSAAQGREAAAETVSEGEGPGDDEAAAEPTAEAEEPEAAEPAVAEAAAEPTAEDGEPGEDEPVEAEAPAEPTAENGGPGVDAPAVVEPTAAAPGEPEDEGEPAGAAESTPTPDVVEASGESGETGREESTG